jgi:hypothetical protein
VAHCGFMSVLYCHAVHTHHIFARESSGKIEIPTNLLVGRDSHARHCWRAFLRVLFVGCMGYSREVKEAFYRCWECFTCL